MVASSPHHASQFRCTLSKYTILKPRCSSSLEKDGVVMEEIAKNVFIDTQYTGIIPAVLRLRDGLVMVDSPLRSDDQQDWWRRVSHLSEDAKQIMVMLDVHSDRLLSNPSVKFPIVAHENALEIIHNLPSVPRIPEVKTSADSEPYDVAQNLRWAVPDMTYSHDMAIVWDDEPVIVTHQPGGHYAGSWVRYDPAKLIFVGDSVVLNQPPFLEWCDLERWIDELNWLSSESFKGYKIISGRNGLVRQKSILKMIDYLTILKEAVDELFASQEREAVMTEVVPNLLKRLNFDREMTEAYKIRLTRGLKHVIAQREADVSA